MNYKETVAYLDSFINYEKKPPDSYARAMKLDRMRLLLKRLGIEYSRLKYIHIAGTKGKGSTATFCVSMLAASGYRVGLYTSPHFFDLTERIALYRRCKQKAIGKTGGIHVSSISRPEVIAIIAEFKPVLENIRSAGGHDTPTFFEIYTALALRYFLKKKPDFVVLETGLGGRLDATNVVTPLISILTSIDYDHTQVLGGTLPEIAREKAGIIKPNVPVVSSHQRPGVLREIKRAGRRNRSKVFLLGTDFDFENVILGSEESRFDFSRQDEHLRGLKIGMKGVCQITNASLALAAMGVLNDEGVLNGSEGFRVGMKAAFISGRFELAGTNPPVVLDVAHNPAAFGVLAKNLCDYYGGEKIVFIFGASSDKDVAWMIHKIPYAEIILTRFQNPRSMPPEEIMRKAKIQKAHYARDSRQALDLARDLIRRKKGTMIVVAGSLFLVADAKRAIRRPRTYV